MSSAPQTRSNPPLAAESARRPPRVRFADAAAPAAAAAPSGPAAESVAPLPISQLPIAPQTPEPVEGPVAPREGAWSNDATELRRPRRPPWGPFALLERWLDHAGTVWRQVGHEVIRLARLYAASIAMHLLVLLSLSYVAISGGSLGHREGTQIEMGGGSQGDDGDGDGLDTSLETLESSGTAVDVETIEPTEALNAGLNLEALATLADVSADALAVGDANAREGNGSGSGGGQGDGQGGGVGLGQALGVGWLPAPPTAVTQGSFTVWTEPADPTPFRPYFIVINVKVKQRTKEYPLSDLSGSVIGTDKYRQEIRYPRGENAEVVDGTVQLRVRVPGAEQLVQDIIRIESRKLKEKQTIRIRF